MTGSESSSKSTKTLDYLVQKAYSNFTNDFKKIKEKYAYDLSKYAKNVTELDFLLEGLRFDALNEIQNKFDALINIKKDDTDKFVEEMAYYIHSLKYLAIDPQISIPNLLIKMFANNEFVAFKHISISDVIFF